MSGGMANRFPPPWTVRHNDDAYWVETANGIRFAYIYFRDPPVVGTGPERPTRDEARRIAANIARLPELLKKP
jgi:hypothetical protein